MATTTPFPASFRHAPARHAVRRPAAGASVRSTQAPLRLTRRGKAVITLAGAIACIGLLQVTGGVQAVATGFSDGPATASVVVQQGETLWEIAKRVAPQADPRATVSIIKELNGLSGRASVKAGQELTVPR